MAIQQPFTTNASQDRDELEDEWKKEVDCKSVALGETDDNEVKEEGGKLAE